MLFWVILAAFIVWFILSAIFGWEYSGAFALISGIMTVVVMFVCIIGFHAGSPARKAKYIEEQRALKYKLESGACRDEFGLLNKEVIDEIQAWNESVTYNKEIQRDFWLGIFVPNIYDDFELIDYEKFVEKGD